MLSNFHAFKAERGKGAVGAVNHSERVVGSTQTRGLTDDYLFHTTRDTRSGGYGIEKVRIRLQDLDKLQ